MLHPSTISPATDCLLIFTRNPELGKIKTRLAQGVGDANALKIYKALLEHTKKVVSKINCTRRVGYSVQVRLSDIWNPKDFEKFQQKGDDLGERMYNAFAKAFSDNFSKVLIIGSDLYDLRTDHIKTAFASLDHNDVVIGPAQDGGYYLLGMTAMHKAVFFNKQWGGETVFQDTITDLKDVKVHHLEMLNDIDYAKDLAPYPEFAHYLK